MRVRAAVADDRAALIDLWVEAWQAAMPGIDFEARRSWIARRLDELAARGAALLVAAEDDEAAGFATVDPEGHVDQLVVAVRHQGHGIARQLIEAARAHGPGRLLLSVNRDNDRAVRFYERQGFRPMGRGVNPASGLAILHMEG